jgi:hypothetical protein
VAVEGIGEILNVELAVDQDFEGPVLQQTS